jgi:hypothetical protein
MARHSENYHTTDTAVNRLIVSTCISWIGKCYSSRISTDLNSMVFVP